MKKLCYLVLVAALFALAAVSASAYEHEDYYKGAQKGEVLNVFNWGEYISDTYEDGMVDVNREFEKLTGIKVNYVTFESNEDMYAKIKNGGVSYDIVVPSDYMIERMVDEDLLQSFDPNELPNYHYIDEKYKGMYYDPDDCYSVPYNVGMVGLIYNTKMVEGTPDSWTVMWDEKYAGKILMIDNPRDAMAIPQKILGYSFNDPDLKQLDDVAQMLIDQKPLLQSYVMDEVFNKMESGEAAMVPYYVGDYIIMSEVNPDLAFVYPKEGVNIFVDAMCIPRTAQNVEAAKKYINFLLDPEIALYNAWYIGYASPNTAVVENEEYADYAENQYLYPDEEHMPNVEYFHNLPQETLKRYSDLWNEIKMAGGTDRHVYIGFAVTGAVIVAYLVWQYAVRRRREHWYDFPKA